MPLKDPTAWMEDFNVFLDDEEITSTAAQLEPEALHRIAPAPTALWLSLVALLGGAFGAVTLSGGIRASLAAFAAYLAGALLLLRGLGPATARLLGRPMAWHAKLTLFWAVLLAWIAVLAARVDTGWLSYGLSAGGGLLVGLVYGGMNPNSVRREDAWMMTALPLGPAGAVGATYLQREVLGGAASVGDAAAVGATAAGVLLVPMSLALVRLWDEAHGLTRAAMLFLHNENFAPKAISFLDRALALAPDDPAVLNLRGVAWSKMDEPERAAADWERAAALRPTDADPLMNVGVDRLRRGDLDAAVTALEAAIRIDGGNATAHSNLGAALERRGDLDRAVEHYDRAIALRPDYANAFSNRGYARFRRGEHREAVDDCDRALALDPNLAQAVVNRAHALGALGQRGEAAASYARALEMQSSPAVQEEALRGLTALGAPAVEHAE